MNPNTQPVSGWQGMPNYSQAGLLPGDPTADILNAPSPYGQYASPDAQSSGAGGPAPGSTQAQNAAQTAAMVLPFIMMMT